ncbi:MAG: threonine--tRNA ligase, partial [Clostridia bacterium]|nr:threonine--tRNA ligase [Clostridia bacterium]
LFDSGVRVELDSRNEKIGYKIRQAQMEKVPYMIIVGEKEQADGMVSVRSRKDGDKGAMPRKEFIDEILTEIKERRR